MAYAGIAAVVVPQVIALIQTLIKDGKSAEVESHIKLLEQELIRAKQEHDVA